MKKLHYLYILIALVSLVSCSNNKKSVKKRELDKSKFVKYAIKSFEEAKKRGVAEARNIRVDTILVISSRTAEKIKARKFERDYKMYCEIDSLPYSKKIEKDSLRNWLKRAEKLPNNDTIGYRVKFKLNYIIDGKLDPEIWIKSFDKNYKSFDDLDGPLLDEEDFLLDDLEE
jgi:hypothetical protein